MGHYENYLKRLNSVPDFFRKRLAEADRRIFEEITKSCPDKKLSVLEIGIGSGGFYELIKEKGWDYTGLDRNKDIADSVPNGIHTSVPPFPAGLKDQKYDLIYSAFVLEHMPSGDRAYELLKECAEHVSEYGEIAILVPDALSIGLEFWSIDYTHGYPTTERNVKQMALDCGLACQKTIRYRGPYIRGIGLFLMRMIAPLYKYRFFVRLFGFEFGFYGAYQMLNQELLLLVFRKNDSVCK